MSWIALDVDNDRVYITQEGSTIARIMYYDISLGSLTTVLDLIPRSVNGTHYDQPAMIALDVCAR